MLSNQGFVVLFTFFCRFKMLSTVIYSTCFIDCVFFSFTICKSSAGGIEANKSLKKREKAKWRHIVLGKKKEQATKEKKTIQFLIDYVYVPFIDTRYETWLIHILFPLMNLIDFGGNVLTLLPVTSDRHVRKKWEITFALLMNLRVRRQSGNTQLRSCCVIIHHKLIKASN